MFMINFPSNVPPGRAHLAAGDGHVGQGEVTCPEVPVGLPEAPKEGSKILGDLKGDDDHGFGEASRISDFATWSVDEECDSLGKFIKLLSFEILENVVCSPIQAIQN